MNNQQTQNINISQLFLEFQQRVNQAMDEEIKKRLQTQTESLKLELEKEIGTKLTEQIKTKIRVELEKEYHEKLALKVAEINKSLNAQKTLPAEKPEQKTPDAALNEQKPIETIKAETQKILNEEKNKIEQEVKAKMEKEIKEEVEKKVKQEVKQETDKIVREKLKQKAAELSPLGVAERQKRKQENLQKVLLLAKDKGNITNDMVQKELLVSDPTATNYLNELVDNNKLKKTGKTRGSSYKLVDF